MAKRTANVVSEASCGSFPLHECLTKQPYRTLWAIARANGCPFDTSMPKLQAVEKLTAFLSTPNYLPEAVSELSVGAVAALRTLQAMKGQMPQSDFVYQFGVLRPYRPWRENVPELPWKAPSSPAEELFYHGLIFTLNLGTSHRPFLVIILPVEYQSALAEIFELPMVSPTESPRVLSPPLFEHLFQWLSFLNRAVVQPLHGRWLPPSAFREIALLIGEPAGAAATAGSERQVPYLAFLHYLAECAGLVTLNGVHLRPTAAALAWLDAPQRSRWEHLWRSWGAPGPENASLWKRYELPLADEPDPQQRFQQVCKLLAAFPPQGEALTFYLNKARETDPALFRPATSYQSWASLDPEAQADYAAGMAEALTRLLRGPLAWFGVVDAAVEMSLSLTALGAALLGRGEEGMPEELPWPGLLIEPGPASAAGPTTFRLRLVAPLPDTPGLRPSARLDLESFAPPQVDAPDRYELTQESCLLALQQGQSLERLLDLLEAAGGPLLPTLVGTLYRWAETAEQVVIRELVILETRDATLMQELTAQRRIRETLLETLSARAVRVDGSRLEALRRRLERQGVIPRVDVPQGQPCTADGLTSEERMTVGAALRVYTYLTALLGTHARAPHTLTHSWNEALGLAERDAAERWAHEVLEKLAQAAPPEGDYHLASPTGPLVEALEQAIAAGMSVDLLYYTAGRDQHIRRRVDPLRLEWHGKVPYLIAFCHLRKAQRVFRVDRIEALEPVPPGAE